MSVEKKYALLLFNLDYILINNYERKLKTYLEIGWDEDSARAFLSDNSNWNKIASFNTTSVTFSASSRRNRFYDIYWKDEFYQFENVFPGGVEALNTLEKRFHLVALSDRNEDTKTSTMTRLGQLGVPVWNVEMKFKGKHETMQAFKNSSLRQVQEKYGTGISLIYEPSDCQLSRRRGFTPIGFTSVFTREQFTDADATCDDWNQVLSVLNTVQ